jgi:hypothetical protein
MFDRCTHPRLGLLFVWLLVLTVPGGAGAEPADGDVYPRPSWGLGWDDGLTLRHWLGDWEIGLAAGPDDYLVKEEYWAWDIVDPEQAQGRLELPLDERDEHGWVRLRTGRLLLQENRLQVVTFLGLTYEWIDHQERALNLDELVGGYDTFELDRFTDLWILEAGLRPSWRVSKHLSCEFSFGLRYVWENWDQTINNTWAGISGVDRNLTKGEGHSFQDFGWDGAASLSFILWR